MMDGAVTGHFRFGISLCKGPEVRPSVCSDLMKGLNARPKNQGLNVRAPGATSGFKNGNGVIESGSQEREWIMEGENKAGEA